VKPAFSFLSASPVVFLASCFDSVAGRASRCDLRWARLFFRVSHFFCMYEMFDEICVM
jgi:hypothetical protein